MANPFYVEPANPFQAIMSGAQGYDQGQKSQQQQALQEAGQLYAAGDIKGAMAAATRGGSFQTLMGLASLQNQDKHFQFQQSEANRAQGNTDRAFGLQQQTAAEAARGFDYREVDDGNGGKVLVKINKATGQVEKPNIAGIQETPNNPYAYGKQNENQSKDSGYANRMFQSEQILRDPKLAAASQSLVDRAADRVLPGDIANKFVTSEGYQKYDQAARDFINATLRRESGAAISASEFDNAYKQYLPRPGDSPELLQQKQRNRQETIKSIAGGGGNTYKPPYIFDASGGMVPNGKAQQAPAAQQAVRTPPEPAITALKQNPALRAAFDAKYGQGASAQYLGQ